MTFKFRSFKKLLISFVVFTKNNLLSQYINMEIILVEKGVISILLKNWIMTIMVHVKEILFQDTIFPRN